MAKTISRKRREYYKKQGRLIVNGVILQIHEQKTINFLLGLGYKIELIRPSYTPNSKNADFIMNGRKWEMKCPEGKSRLTMEHIIRKASHQSENILIDLRRLRLEETLAIRQSKYEFSRRPSIKSLWLITKKEDLIVLQR